MPTKMAPAIAEIPPLVIDLYLYNFYVTFLNTRIDIFTGATKRGKENDYHKLAPIKIYKKDSQSI